MARTLWVLGLAALALLVMYGMRRGWLNRARRQAALLAEFPKPPADLGGQRELLSPATGLYVGTTVAGDWQNRVTVGDIGNRASATARLYERGLLIERSGASSIWIPAESIQGARLDHKLANKVVPGVGLVVVTWQLDRQQPDGQQPDGQQPDGQQLDGQQLETGFRDEIPDRQSELINGVNGAFAPIEGANGPLTHMQDETAQVRQEER